MIKQIKSRGRWLEVGKNGVKAIKKFTGHVVVVFANGGRMMVTDNELEAVK